MVDLDALFVLNRTIHKESSDHLLDERKFGSFLFGRS